MGRLVAFLLVATTLLPASAPEGTVIVFYGEGCPHCAAEVEFLDGLVAEHPDIEVVAHEVWHDDAGRRLFIDTMAARGAEAEAVPTTIVGDQVWVGYSDAVGAEIAAALGVESEARTGVVDVPLVGPVDVGATSLVVATVAIAFVDGVNPCSLWVLSLLLALVLHGGSRRRVLAVGLVFLAVTAAMYAVYVAGLAGALAAVGGTLGARIAVAGIALAFGALNIKDYVAFGRGPSLTIPAGRKPAVYRRMRRIADPGRRLPAVLTGTAALAVGVSVVETPCTAGLPLVWSGLLAEHGATTVETAALFGLYMTVFLVDELVVLGVAVVTLRATKLGERGGRLLKLLGGTVMVAVAGALIADPAAMATPAGMAAVFLAGGVLAGGIALAVRVSSHRRAPAPARPAHPRPSRGSSAGGAPRRGKGRR